MKIPSLIEQVDEMLWNNSPSLLPLRDLLLALIELERFREVLEIIATSSGDSHPDNVYRAREVLKMEQR